MDPSRSSPRRQLQGPRPPPLRLSKDSVKIKKPPPHPHLPPPPSHPTAPTDQPPQGFEPRRKPVIIYDASPKVIHTKPGDFMSLVQRLTGQGSSDPATATAGATATSPAARLAAIERSVTPSPRPARNPTFDLTSDLLDVLQFPIGSDDQGLGLTGQGLGLTGHLPPPPPPGILSPMPASLPPVSPGFFSPLSFDPSCLTILNELSPVFSSPAAAGNGNGGTGNFYSSCSSPFTFSPVIASPGYNSDLFSMLEF